MLLLRLMLLWTIIIVIIVIVLLPNRIPYTISIAITFIITTIIIITNFKMLHFHIEDILSQLVNNLLFILYLILQRQYIGP